MRSTREVLARGVLAGFLGATTLVVWLFVVDLLLGQPLFTPRFLAGMLLGTPVEQVGFAILAVYTLVHYVVFLLIGAAVAMALQKLPPAPGFLLGVVLGFLLFNLLFYGSALISGGDVIAALGWRRALSGNLLAGIVIMAYLHLSGTVPTGSWLGSLRRVQVVRQGVLVGLIGAGVVAVWFLLVDALAGRPFFTPAALGSALLFGARSIHEVDVSVATVAGFTLVHIGAFLIFGLVLAALVINAERFPPLLLGLFLLFAVFQTLLIGLLTIVAVWILDALGWGSIAIANLLAAIAMAVYMWKEHPALAELLRSRSLEEPG